MEGSGNSFGSLLPDQFERIAGYFEAHVELVADVREIYNSRALLEREYAAKLHALAKKAADKKARMEQHLAVGPDPAKTWDKGILKSCTLNSAYDEIITSISSAADDHVSHADAINTQVVEVLRVVERRSDEVKKKELAFFSKLLTDRDRTYADRLKNKQKYDDDCAEVETIRQKQSRAHDDKHADRAAKQAEQQRNDMLNSKNVYLISIAIANQAKARFYTQDLPRLEDEYQAIRTRLVHRLAKILVHCQRIDHGHIDSLKSHIAKVESKLNAIDPVNDDALFASYNARPFSMPVDWTFEPCAIHYDTGDMSVDAAPKVFIQNKLRKCKDKLKELTAVINSKRNEAAKLSQQISSYTPDHTLGTIDDLTDSHLEAEHQLMLFQTSEDLVSVEMQTIVAAVGDDVGGTRPHQFKSSSFSIPTTCSYCKTSIWGLTKQGKTCKACGVSVHTKCELKVPASCGQSESAASAGTRAVQRSNTSSSTASRTSSRFTAPPLETMPTASSFVKDNTHSSQASIAESYPSAKVLFDFKASSEFELAIREDEIVQIVEGDDGSGWVKVLNEHGASGLVPATYLEEIEEPEAAPAYAPPPPAATGPQGSGERVRAIYDYTSQGSDELSLREGEILELTSGATGGKMYADGWWEGYNSRGEKGIFPSNYVEEI